MDESRREQGTESDPDKRVCLFLNTAFLALIWSDLFDRSTRHRHPQRLLDRVPRQPESSGEEMNRNRLLPSKPDRDVASHDAGFVGLSRAVGVAGFAAAFLCGLLDGFADDDGGLGGGHGLVK